MKLVEDPEVNAYIQSVGHRLSSHSGATGQSFSFFVVDAPDVNAFAGPGGKIGIHTGLILTTHTESELASVIAHEIAHVTQRHLARAIDEASRMQPLAMVGMLGALLLGTQNAEAGQAALMSTVAASAQGQINFTRANEKEADRVGMTTLSSADFDPYGMPAFFERLQKANQYASGGQIPEFLRTHPVTISRISDSKGRAAQLGHNPVSDSFNYLLTRARLTAEAAAPSKAIPALQTVPKDETAEQRDARLFALALSRARNGQIAEAEQDLRKLLEKHPNHPVFLYALGELLLDDGQADSAVVLLQPAVKLYPENKGLNLALGRGLIALREGEKARRLLVDYLHDYGPSPEVYKLVAQASQTAGKSGESHAYLAEYYHDMGYSADAIQQLEIGLDQPGLSYYETERITARLKQWREEQSEKDDH